MQRKLLLLYRKALTPQNPSIPTFGKKFTHT